MNSSDNLPILIFRRLQNTKVWIVGATIAIVASIETLLCLEAGDKMDPLKRYSSANTELKAQGIGNIFSGFAWWSSNDICYSKNNGKY